MGTKTLILTFGAMTLSIVTLKHEGLICDIQHNDIQHKRLICDTQHKKTRDLYN